MIRLFKIHGRQCVAMAYSERWTRNAHQKETNVSCNDSLQVRPFSKWELLLKERICSQKERILTFKSSSLMYEISLLQH